MSATSESTEHPGDRGGSQAYSRDSEFFIDLKPLYLRAEKTLFCVPRHYFQTSDVFDGMFTLPGAPQTPQEGSSEEYPLFLESINAEELREFLRVLSSRFATSNNTTIRSITSSWLPVLKLASLWQFSSLREKALKYLKSADCMTRLHIARQYGVDDWFLPAVRDLISREEPLTGDEIGQLGLDFAAKVIALRDEALLSLMGMGGGAVVLLALIGRIPTDRVLSDDKIRRRFEEESDTSA
ncbi:hypothetical protein V8D89_012648 [Ganoderma adspersum]